MLYNILCLMLSFWFLWGFWWNYFMWLFYTIHSMLRSDKEIPELIFHLKISIYNELFLCIKGCKIFWQIICVVVHHKSYGLGFIYVDELCNHIFYILVNIIVFLRWWLYNTLYVWCWASKSWKFSILFANKSCVLQHRMRGIICEYILIILECMF